MWRPRWIDLGWFGLGLSGGGLLVVVITRAAQAQDLAAVPPAAWISLTSLLSVVGIGVVWGRLQQQGRHHRQQIDQLCLITNTVVPRAEVDARIAELRRETRDAVLRIEDKLEALWLRFADGRDEDRRAREGERRDRT